MDADSARDEVASIIDDARRISRDVIAEERLAHPVYVSDGPDKHIGTLHQEAWKPPAWAHSHQVSWRYGPGCGEYGERVTSYFDMRGIHICDHAEPLAEGEYMMASEDPRITRLRTLAEEAEAELASAFAKVRAIQALLEPGAKAAGS